MLFDEDTPPLPATPEPIVIRPVPKDYNTEVVDMRVTPGATLMTHTEGSSWILRDYYSQVKGGDNPLLGQQLNLSPHLQQYTRIKKLEFKVTQDLRPTQDPSTGEFLATGNSNVYGDLIPNVGDMFTATNGDGRLCVFKITQSTKNSMLKAAVYSVEYHMVYFAEKVYLDDFEAKTIRTFVFQPNNINYGQSPYLQEEEANLIEELAGYYGSIMRMWFKSFLSVEYNTFILPGQTISIYDHWVTGAVMSVFTTYDAPEIRRIRRLNVDDDSNMALNTLWDVIIQGDNFLMKEAIKRVGGLYTGRFTYQPLLDGIRYSGVNAVVYPINPVRTFDYIRTFKEQLVDEGIVLLKTMDPLPVEQGKLPLIKPVTIDDHYVLSQAFYEQTDNEQSLLEIQVRAYLNNEALDHRILVELVKNYTNWGGLERFYYGILLLILIKASIRSV